MAMSSFPLFHHFWTSLFYGILLMTLMHSNKVSLESVSMQILTPEGIYTEWPQTQKHDHKATLAA